MKKVHRLRRGLLLLLLLLVLGALLLHIRVDPLTEELAMAKISDAASDKINEVIHAQIEAGNIQYDNLITLQKDADGNITAMTTNMREMNRLKTGLLTILDQDVNKISADEIGIPLGSLTGIQMLSGRGPMIPVKIVAVSSSDAVFRGTFSDAGINQTIHRIMMEVSLDLMVLLPSGTATTQVGTEVCVAETVLLGSVPQSYAYFNTAANEE